MKRRHLLCCGAAAAGLFTSLGASSQRNPCRDTAPLFESPELRRCWDGLDASELWDCHAHLLGTGDSGSGCSIDTRMTQWWHPAEVVRRRVIMNGACVPPDAPSVDRAYVARLTELADQFPAGARWLLFAFDQAHDDAGRACPGKTTFAVPNAYAAQVAAVRPDRFAWVASVHPYREDALPALDAALRAGAVAIKWLPSSMNIDLRDPRLAPFYARLAASRVPLIVHCGEEKAVPGAGRGELGNPLHARVPLAAGVRVIMAHCASLGEALDLDLPRPRLVPAFSLFARLMDEPAWRELLLGDVSALFQFNRRPEVWQTVLSRADWHPRLLHGSDYPLPGVVPLVQLRGLVRAGLLSGDTAEALDRLREHNPLLFDLALKRSVRWRGLALGPEVYATRRHFVPTA